MIRRAWRMVRRWKHRPPRIVLWGARHRDWVAGHEPAFLVSSPYWHPGGPRCISLNNGPMFYAYVRWCNTAPPGSTVFTTSATL